MVTAPDELVFVALGGLGEIGMNAALYGFGPPARRKWLMVDCGLGFRRPRPAGHRSRLCRRRFIEKIRRDLVGLVITHAHEDHVGGIAALWPQLRCPVYGTRFAMSLLEARRLSEPGAPEVPLNIVEQGGRDRRSGRSISSSLPSRIPSPRAARWRSARRPGTVVHSGDWKIDAQPGVGRPTDEARLRAIGDEGVLALVCDSTNILREGESPSEADVAATLARSDRGCAGARRRHRFRLECRAHRARSREAAAAAGREVVVVGRAMERTDRGRARMRLSRRRRRRSSRSSASAASAARPDRASRDRQPGRAARRHRAHRAGRTSRDLARIRAIA